MVVHAFNLSTWKAEKGNSLSRRSVWYTQKSCFETPKEKIKFSFMRTVELSSKQSHIELINNLVNILTIISKYN